MDGMMASPSVCYRIPAPPSPGVSAFPSLAGSLIRELRWAQLLLLAYGARCMPMPDHEPQIPTACHAPHATCRVLPVHVQSGWMTNYPSYVINMPVLASLANKIDRLYHGTGSVSLLVRRHSNSYPTPWGTHFRRVRRADLTLSSPESPRNPLEPQSASSGRPLVAAPYVAHRRPPD